MVSSPVRNVLSIAFLVVLSNSCTTVTDKQSSRGTASAAEEGENSCKSQANKEWFNDGKYSISEKKKPSWSSEGDRWDIKFPNDLAPYSAAPPPKGKLKETWTSPFSQTANVPGSRSEFFDRGTMYYFEVAGMEEPLQGAEANWRLLAANIVGPNSKINVYRIDKTPEALNQECPTGNKGQFVGTIPFFSLRTSGNRTNQMPKSSFKVKILNAKKWEKLAKAQYQGYLKTLRQGPQEINSIATAFQQSLPRIVNEKVLAKLKQLGRTEFIQFYTDNPLELSDSDRWKAGQLRNGMLYWKGQLDEAVSYVDRTDLDSVANRMKSDQEFLMKLGAAQRTSFSAEEQKRLEDLGVFKVDSSGRMDAKETSSAMLAQAKNLSEALPTLAAFTSRKTGPDGWMSQIERRKAAASNDSSAFDFWGMDSINLKAMWNDPSQMREALAWYMFEKAGVVAPKQTYAKLCFGKTYRGVFAVVEQIDEGFVADRNLVSDPRGGQTPAHQRANIYKVYMGTEDVGLDIEQLREAFAATDLKGIPNGEDAKQKVINAFIDNPYRGKKALAVSPFRDLEPYKTWLANEDFYFSNIGGGTLLKRAPVNVQAKTGQISPYFKAKEVENRTYQLQTDWEGNMNANFHKALPEAVQYKDLESLIEAINSGSYESDVFFTRMERVLDTKAFLRWAALTVLLGGWDNYYLNPQNYYLLNKTPFTANGQSGGPAKFTLLPWDYDQSFSMSFGQTATLWWNTDILDWESMRREKRPFEDGVAHSDDEANAKAVKRPLITNMLKNPKYRSYYLKFIDWMIYNYFNVDNVVSLIGKDFSLDAGQVSHWQSTYQPTVADRQQKHQLRIRTEVWDTPGVSESTFQATYMERMIREISNPEAHAKTWFAGVKGLRGTPNNLTWRNFQNDYANSYANAEKSAGKDEIRCDQEDYVEPRGPADVGQCQESDYKNPPVYPKAWREQSATEGGIWNLIASSVYQEHMGLGNPRWDIMSRTGRQYRNSMVYENGYLGRRIVWKELWQESPDKCTRQFKIFEGIEHHVRERGRTALEQISLANKKYRIYKDEEDRKKILNLPVAVMGNLAY